MFSYHVVNGSEICLVFKHGIKLLIRKIILNKLNIWIEPSGLVFIINNLNADNSSNFQMYGLE
jgi:hypothetical protein